MSHIVDHAIEIICINEQRVSFIPRLWRYEPDTVYSTSLVPSYRTLKAYKLEQIWVPGCHGDVACPSDTLIADIVLLTMFQRIRSLTKLPLNQDYIDKVYQRVILKTKHVGINDNSRMFRRKRRRAEMTPVAMAHPICYYLDKRFVKYNNRRRMFSITELAQGEDGRYLNDYDFDLRSVVTSDRAAPQELVYDAVEWSLSQIGTR